MKISLNVSPSKTWWTYLALKSNPRLSCSTGSVTQAIFFDSLANLPQGSRVQPASLYYFICWDGITEESEVEEVRQLLQKKLNVLVVGDSSPASKKSYPVGNLFPEGELRFASTSLRFDARTTARLLLCRIKSLLIPLKNLIQQRHDLARQVQLLVGRKKIVFCGSYGTIPRVIAELCKRHAVDLRLFDEYSFYSAASQPSFERYIEHLRTNGEFLAALYDRRQINHKFLLSAVHLLGREYFLERIKLEGLDLFVHGYASGSNINVYSTPFYKQHVFLDFGSAVGKGNYPRIADLRYFKKKLVPFDIEADLEATANLARSGILNQHFEAEWLRKSQLLSEAMR